MSVYVYFCLGGRLVLMLEASALTHSNAQGKSLYTNYTIEKELAVDAIEQQSSRALKAGREEKEHDFTAWRVGPGDVQSRKKSGRRRPTSTEINLKMVALNRENEERRLCPHSDYSIPTVVQCAFGDE
eukprot:686469-Pleurochrysis_carterae.AAC.1